MILRFPDNAAAADSGFRELLIRWLRLRFGIDSTVVRRPFDCLSNVVKVS